MFVLRLYVICILLDDASIIGTYQKFTILSLGVHQTMCVASNDDEVIFLVWEVELGGSWISL